MTYSAGDVLVDTFRPQQENQLDVAILLRHAKMCWLLDFDGTVWDCRIDDLEVWYVNVRDMSWKSGQ